VGANEIFPGRIRRRLLGVKHGKDKDKNGQNGQRKAARLGHLRQQSPELLDYFKA
jgi:hypothetical protein